MTNENEGHYCECEYPYNENLDEILQGAFDELFEKLNMTKSLYRGDVNRIILQTVKKQGVIDMTIKVRAADGFGENAKPCPWPSCKGSTILPRHDAMMKLFWYQCVKCETVSPSKSSSREAADAWNNRVGPVEWSPDWGIIAKEFTIAHLVAHFFDSGFTNEVTSTVSTHRRTPPPTTPARILEILENPCSTEGDNLEAGIMAVKAFIEEGARDE